MRVRKPRRGGSLGTGAIPVKANVTSRPVLGAFGSGPSRILDTTPPFFLTPIKGPRHAIMAQTSSISGSTWTFSVTRLDVRCAGQSVNSLRLRQWPLL